MPRRNPGPRLRWLDKRGCWYIVWTDGGRSRERSCGTADLLEAQGQFARFMHEQQRRAGPRDPAETLITDILNDYATDRGGEIRAAERVGYALDPLIEFFTGKSVQAVTRETCAAYGRWRRRSPGTIRRELGVLRAAINHGYGEGRLTRPVAVTLPPPPPSKERWLSKTEAAALLRAALRSKKARLYLPLFIIIGLHTGRRKDAILSLRWPQVDLQRGIIHWMPEGEVETKKRRPAAPIPPKLLPFLKRARRRGSDLGYVVHDQGERIGDIKKSFASACQRAGLESVVPHTLRHSRASWGMQAGTPTGQLARFLGMTEDTLVKVYGHHHPEWLVEAASRY